MAQDTYITLYVADVSSFTSLTAKHTAQMNDMAMQGWEPIGQGALTFVPKDSGMPMGFVIIQSYCKDND